eukprot:GHVQ01037005.1.p1 GENE.GHVQ01037005.1~~GHVQ01037005.1.p1  ORF type:complete len:604 (+),score=62.12 GHVQ01037005.1:219-2030(+)
MGTLRSFVILSCYALSVACPVLVTFTSPVSAKNHVNSSSVEPHMSFQRWVKTPLSDIVSNVDEVKTSVVLITVDRVVDVIEGFIRRVIPCKSLSSGLYREYVLNCVIAILERFNKAWAMNFPGEDNVLMVSEKPLKAFLQKVTQAHNAALASIPLEDETIPVDPEVQEVMRKVCKTIEESGLHDMDGLTDIFLGTLLDMRVKHLEATDVSWRNLLSVDKTRAAALTSLLWQPSEVVRPTQQMELDKPTQPLEASKGLARTADAMTGESATGGITVTEVAESLLRILTHGIPGQAKRLRTVENIWVSNTSLLTSQNLTEDRRFFRVMHQIIMIYLSAGDDSKVLRRLALPFAKTVFGSERASELVPEHQPSSRLKTGPMEILMYALMGDGRMTSAMSSASQTTGGPFVSFPPLEELKTLGTPPVWTEWADEMMVIGKNHEEFMHTSRSSGSHISEFLSKLGLYSEYYEVDITHAQIVEGNRDTLWEPFRKRLIGKKMFLRDHMTLNIIDEKEGRWLATAVSILMFRGAWDKRDWDKVLEWLVRALHRGAKFHYVEFGSLLTNSETSPADTECDSDDNNLFDLVKLVGPGTEGAEDRWNRQLGGN